ncbi:hypothetical protein MNB_SV-5-1031 [hydrothermal vent metagenome]|uniref:Uncharacterized protein n=1 Tax=hydrothermal vent metagenome TaxID=652676 RepID=A0A1W1EED1_9ZZZZ
MCTVGVTSHIKRTLKNLKFLYQSFNNGSEKMNFIQIFHLGSITCRFSTVIPVCLIPLWIDHNSIFSLLRLNIKSKASHLHHLPGCHRRTMQNKYDVHRLTSYIFGNEIEVFPL